MDGDICLKLHFLICLIAWSCLCVYTEAAEKKDVTGIDLNSPKIELGFGMVGQYGPDYRGSSYKELQALPIPYVRYESDRIQLSRRGLDGRLFSSERFRLNVSADGSLNGSSDDNPIREGMPELHTAIEFGPSLEIKLFGRSFNDGFSFRLPLRAVFTVDPSHSAHRGFLFNPRFTWKSPQLLGDVRSSLNIGALYGSEDYHQYYYSVEPRFVTSTRALYKAKEGYSGEYLRWTFYKKYQSWRLAFSLRYDNVSHAVFADSPLVDSNHFIGFGFSIFKVFWKNQAATLSD